MTRALAVLFVTGWLGFAIQPCLAMDHPADAVHSGHPIPAGQIEHECPHCPPALDPGAGGGQGVVLACGGADAPVLPVQDARTAQPDLVLLTGFAAFQSPAFGAIAAPDHHPDAAPWHPPSASLQQRFCIFLK